ncbi:hypothetical protein CVIRNUC_011023 [Coccomyxa viridis]|uniref:Uncharacterized protein n=1 Tax=Coccomyxa viridis TaxID=1274662 RepID=A0AAV1IKE2_9CHLO|nr:hypothetical protein CVIRNUC_011023 [Coccomyxa viridis]
MLRSSLWQAAHIMQAAFSTIRFEAGLGPLAAGKHVQQTTRSFSKDHSADELLEPEWRRVESSIPVVCCMVMPIVLGTAVSYMHYSNPAWRKRRGHAPASIHVANPPWPVRPPGS